MNIKEFEYIAEIAAQESISKAAARLYLSQPTLTKFLKKIEAEFETPLFNRVGKKMIPTPAGQACVEKARQIIELNEQLNKQVHSLRQQDHGYVRIGTSASRGEFFVSQILPQMTKRFPDACFTLTLEAKTDLLRRLENDELDIIFVNNSSRRPYLDYVDIAREEMVLVAPEGHELLRKAADRPEYPYPYVSLEDWADYPFIMADIRMNTGQYARMLFAHYGRTPRIVLEVASLQFIYSAVRQNIGITIAPSMPLFQPGHTGLRYLSFEDDRQIQWHFTAIKKAQMGRHRLLEELMETVKTQYGPAAAPPAP